MHNPSNILCDVRMWLKPACRHQGIHPETVCKTFQTQRQREILWSLYTTSSGERGGAACLWDAAVYTWFSPQGFWSDTGFVQSRELDLSHHQVAPETKVRAQTVQTPTGSGRLMVATGDRQSVGLCGCQMRLVWKSGRVISPTTLEDSSHFEGINSIFSMLFLCRSLKKTPHI